MCACLIIQDSGVTRYMNRSDGCEGIIEIKHNTDPERVDQDTWLVVRKRLTNASKVNSKHTQKLSFHIQSICAQFKAEVEVTEVALAFPLEANIQTVILAKVNVLNATGILYVSEDLLFILLCFSFSTTHPHMVYTLLYRTCSNSKCLLFYHCEVMGLDSLFKGTLTCHPQGRMSTVTVCGTSLYVMKFHNSFSLPWKR